MRSLHSQHTCGALLLACSFTMACTEKVPEHTQLSQQPPTATQVATNSQVYQSSFSTRARIAYSDLASLAEDEVPAEHTDTGRQKICKKVLGLKLCGNARWNYTVLREGEIQISGQDDFVAINLPMRFFGDAGIGGDVAKVLNINAMKFDGAMNAQILLKLDLQEDWCPTVKSDVSYQWTSAPKLEWAAGIDINLEDRLDKAIKKQLSSLQAKAANAIDCQQFRQAIQTQWKQHSIPLDLPGNETMYLNIEPDGFSFSGIKTEADKLGLAFSLDTKTSVQNQALPNETLPLPALSRSEYQAGQTTFNVLVRARYMQLQSIAEEQIKGKTFSESSAAGNVSVTIDTLNLSGNPEGVTVDLGFRAMLPGKKLETPGNVYLTATPVLDAFTQTVRLTNISLSNVLDSTMWTALAKVFEGQIIKQIQSNAVLELGPKLRQVSTILETQLADPARTKGLKIDSPTVDVVLQRLIPEQDNLAALLKVETQLDIDVPIKTLYQSSRK